MPTSDPILLARGRLAGLHRGANPDPVAVANTRRELNAALLERAIQWTLDAAPPLTDEQRTRLAALLTGGVR